MVTSLEGARPITVISRIAFIENTLGNYLITNRERSRNADYEKVKMPDFYVARVKRNYGKNLLKADATYEEFIQIYS
jgi:hypothetical protein